MDGNYNTRTEFTFKKQGARWTRVDVSEHGWRPTPKGIQSAFLNCYGWTQMTAALKVYLEHGINLRKGYFKRH